MLFELLVAHAFSDFAFQPSEMGKGKNRHKRPDYIPPGMNPATVWIYYSIGHALINGGMVYLVTGSEFLGIAETMVHWTIDFLKCDGRISPQMDQMVHLSTKIIYCVALGVL